jgi:hypothetical protein
MSADTEHRIAPAKPPGNAPAVERRHPERVERLEDLPKGSTIMQIVVNGKTIKVDPKD